MLYCSHCCNTEKETPTVCKLMAVEVHTYLVHVRSLSFLHIEVRVRIMFLFFFVPVLGVGIYARGHEGGDLSGRPK